MLPFPHDGSLLMKPTSSGGAEMYTERATPGPPASPPAPAHVLARKVWAAFAFTFVLSRILVFLIMSGRMPDIHSHFRGTHLHHLNYGIFLLAGVGAALLFSRPTGRWLSATAILYGVALALTFDEFGMWLHLDTDYWQRVSFDAVVVVGALLGLVATSPALRQFRPRHWATAIALIATLALFGIVLLDSYRYAGRKLGPYLEQVRPPRRP